MNTDISDIYNLSQSVYHHKNILRTVACNSKGVVVTGSFDKTCAFFARTDENGPYIHLKSTNYHDDYIYIVRPELIDRGFFSGSKDAKIIFMDNEGNPLGEYIGHTATVSDISQAEPETFISGSWDTTARVWDINTQKSLFVLKDHAYAVATLALENKRYITGSQDKKLKIWDKDRVVKTIDNAHDDIIRSIILSADGQSFYTCSNDYHIKHWTLGGDLLEQFTGHDGFIFRLGVNKNNNTLFSAADDRIVKTWQNTKCTQDIFHPNTIWDLAINPSTEELITACADGVMRVFSKNPSKWLSAADLEDYTNLCFMSNKQEESNESVDVNKLPKIEDIKKIKSPKEGEIRVFNNGGLAEAYVFKGSNWEKIGEVLGTKENKKFYPGDKCFPAGEYDYIFDVDLEGRKSVLPFNKGDNVLVAAEKFISREELHKGLYIDDITKFLRANTQSTSQPLKQVEKKKPEPIKQNINSNSMNFPKTAYSKYESINTDGPLKKIIEFNTLLIENKSSQALTNPQIESIKNFLKTISNVQFYHTSNFNSNEIELFCKILVSWPDEYSVPLLDLFRMFLLHPRSNDLFQKIGGGVGEVAYLLNVLKTGTEIQKILVLRSLNNMFIYDASRTFMIDKRQEMLDNASVFLDSENKNIKAAVVGLLLKYLLLNLVIQLNFVTRGIMRFIYKFFP
jgi:phospholipase A-2-activating protein